MRIYLLSLAVAAFGLFGIATAPAPECLRDVAGCVDGVVCLAGSKAGLHCA